MNRPEGRPLHPEGQDGGAERTRRVHALKERSFTRGLVPFAGQGKQDDYLRCRESKNRISSDSEICCCNRGGLP